MNIQGCLILECRIFFIQLEKMGKSFIEEETEN